MSVSKTQSPYYKFPSADFVMQPSGQSSQVNLVTIREILKNQGYDSYIKPSSLRELRVDLGPNELLDIIDACPKLYPYFYSKSDDLCFSHPESDVPPAASKMGLKGKFL